MRGVLSGVWIMYAGAQMCPIPRRGGNSKVPSSLINITPPRWGVEHLTLLIISVWGKQTLMTPQLSSLLVDYHRWFSFHDFSKWFTIDFLQVIIWETVAVWLHLRPLPVSVVGSPTVWRVSIDARTVPSPSPSPPSLCSPVVAPPTLQSAPLLRPARAL